MSSKRGRGWRGGATPRKDRTREKGVSRSWRRSRGSGATVRTGGGPSKKRGLKLIVALLLLVAFVAGGIYLWRINPHVHTHFVTIDLLQQTPIVPRSAAPEFPPDKARGWSVSTVTSSPSTTLKFAESREAGSSGGAFDPDAHVAVVYANLFSAPAEKSAHRILTSNATQNIAQKAEYEDLSLLHGTLKSLPEKQYKLLLLDLETAADWRLGTVGDDLVQSLKSWPDEIPNLVIVASSGDGQPSWNAGSSAAGESVFGNIVQQAFTQAADMPEAGRKQGDGHVSASEFCRFVQTQTDDWVRNNRSTTGQQVQIIPALDQITAAGSKLDFMVMKEVPAPLELPAADVDSASVSQLSELWQQRQNLAERSALIWEPLRWRASGNLLRAAQQACLEGRTKDAAALIENARSNLQKLEELTPVADAIAADRGLRADWFSTVPSARRLERLFRVALQESSAAAGGPLAEDVLAAWLQSYPFAASGLPEQASGQRQTAPEMRKQVEDSVAGAFGIAAATADLVRAQDAAVASAEDLLFVSDDSGLSPDVLQENARNFYSALQEFSIARQQAETSLRWALDEIPSLTQLSASLGAAVEGDEQGFLEALKPGSAAVPPRKAGEDSTLPADTIRAVRQSATLIDLLYGTAASADLSLNEMVQRTTQLRSAASELDKARSAAGKAIADLVSGCTSSPEQTDKRIALRQKAQRLLDSTSLTADQRTQLLSKVIELDDLMLQAFQPGSTSPAGSDGKAATAGSAAWQAAWMLQTHYLLTAVTGDTDRRDELSKEVIALSKAEGSDHERRARLGLLVREHWSDVADRQTAAAEAAAGSLDERYTTLERADAQARLMTSTRDITGRLSESPMTPAQLVHSLRRFRYCALQADRAIRSRWLAENEQDKQVAQQWYASQANTWLAAAEQDAAGLRQNSQAPLADLMTGQVQQQRQLLQSVSGLAFTSQVPGGELILSESERQRLQATIAVRANGDQHVNGLAAVRMISPSEAIGIDDNSPALSVPLGSQAATKTFTVRIAQQPGSDDCGTVPLKTDVFFRGQVWSAQGPFANPCPADERVIRLAGLEDTGSIVVEGQDIRPIMFVLDWSGSMDKNGVGRHITTLETVESILNNLTADDHVGLVVYGHRMNGSGIRNTRYEEVFGRPINISLDREDVEILIEPVRLGNNKDKLLYILDKQLRIVPPWGTTPLGLALTTAAEYFNTRNQNGLIIAVTDGAATDVGDARELKRDKIINADDKDLPGITAANRRTLEELKRAFKIGKCDAVIVALDLVKEGPENRHLTNTFGNDPIKFDILNAKSDQTELYARISEQLDPRDYVVSGSATSSEERRPLGDVTRGLQPDRYTVSFADMKSGDISIRPGDALRMRPDYSSGKLKVTRDQPRQSVSVLPASVAGNAAADDPASLGAMTKVVVNETTGDMASVSVTVMLNHDNPFRPVRQPAEIHFDLRAVGMQNFQAKQITQTFTYTYENNAPGWRLEMNPWPKDSGVEIDSFWKMQRTDPDLTLSLADILQAEGRNNAKAFGGSDNLPRLLVWSVSRDGGKQLQIGLAPDPDAPPAANSPQHTVRVELGTLDALDRHFEPLNWTRTVTLVDNGAGVTTFFSEEGALASVGNATIAFTSRESLERDAVKVAKLVVEGFDR